MIKIKKPDFIFLKIPKKIIFSVVSVFVILLFYHSLFIGRIYPGISIAGINVSGKTPEEAIELLKYNVKKPEDISLSFKEKSFSIPISSLNLNYDLISTADKAYKIYRADKLTANIFSPLLFFINPSDILFDLNLNEEELKKNLSFLVEETSQEPVYPKVYLSDNEVFVEKGAPGYIFDEEKAIKDIKLHLRSFDNSTINISTILIDPSITQEHATILYERANNILDKYIILSFEYQEIRIEKNKLISLLKANGEYNIEELNLILSDVALKTEREPQNPVFVFSEGKVNEFTPAKEGIKINKEELSKKILLALKDLEESEEKSISITIPTVNTPSEYKTGDVNNLGIIQLIGRGKSRFTGSISSRIHNISLASSKLNGILIKPGDILSFNEVLGDVSAFTGYQQAYVIQDGKTVLGDGGGVCQVSTTLFRAVLNAGLPIIERRPHSYRVGYYEQESPVGLDATVFSPSTDFKFQNDTPAHLLIQTSVDVKTKTLIFEIYGTSDGRISSVSKPLITSVTPPPDDLYIDDPTLSTGTVKQIDWKAWGAKVSFKYTVTRDGVIIIDKVFNSNYQPWQAKFLRGTGQ